MIERRTGDIVVTSSLAAHFPTPWEPVYASSKWAINCFVQTVRRQVFKHGIRVGSISPGPVITALIADWPEDKLKEAKESGSLIEPSEVANAVMFMPDTATRNHHSRRRCYPPISTSRQAGSIRVPACVVRRLAEQGFSGRDAGNRTRGFASANALPGGFSLANPANFKSEPGDGSGRLLAARAELI